jgi:hypothetical protein
MLLYMLNEMGLRRGLVLAGRGSNARGLTMRGGAWRDGPERPREPRDRVAGDDRPVHKPRMARRPAFHGWRRRRLRAPMVYRTHRAARVYRSASARKAGLASESGAAECARAAMREVEGRRGLRRRR